jgi:hypothetical protein
VHGLFVDRKNTDSIIKQNGGMREQQAALGLRGAMHWKHHAIRFVGPWRCCGLKKNSPWVSGKWGSSLCRLTTRRPVMGKKRDAVNRDFRKYGRMA